MHRAESQYRILNIRIGIGNRRVHAASHHGSTIARILQDQLHESPNHLKPITSDVPRCSRSAISLPSTDEDRCHDRGICVLTWSIYAGLSSAI
jgi:hypothetical protein